jgi:dolichol-phosphate mannosyltransferase
MNEATGDAVVLLDGDLQDPPELIEEFAEKWISGYDVVYGSRVKRDTSLLMNISYKIFYRIFNKLSYINIPLDAGDFSLMDRKVVDAINSLKESDRFIRGLRAWTGFKQIGVPYNRPERQFGKSTNNFFKNIQWAKKGIFSFSHLPLEIMSLISYLVFLFSGIAVFIYTLLYFLKDEAPKGVTTLIVLVLFLGAVQLLSISILSEYIAKILDETKKRPNFIVKRIINKKK